MATKAEKTVKQNREIKLIEQANKLQKEINYIVLPFVEPEHPAFAALQDHMVAAAEQGDYTLIESVNEKVEQLTKERVAVMKELNELRRGSNG